MSKRIEREIRDSLPYVSIAQLNAQRMGRYSAHYDNEDLDAGSTAPPSECTLRRAYLFGRDNRRSNMPLLSGVSDGREFLAYNALKEEILDFYGIFSEQLPEPKELRKIKKRVFFQKCPVPSELEQEVLEAGLLFVDFLGDEPYVPNSIITAIESFIKDPVGYRRLRNIRLSQRDRRRN